MQILGPLRQIKHGLMLARKRLYPYRLRLTEAFDRRLSQVTPFEFELSDYLFPPEGGANAIHADSTFPVNHLFYEPTLPITDQLEPAESRAFVFWTGNNPLTSNRQRSLKSLQSNHPAIEVILVDQESLHEWIVPEHPLHPAYEHLSYVHRADYLRAYFMYHHGGIYIDIKPIEGSLAKLLERINASDSTWGGGMRELSSTNVGAAIGGKLGRDQRRHYSLLPAASCHAFKPGSPITAEWLSEVERRLDYFAHLLERNPATDPNGVGNNYPIPWFTLLGNVFGPLCLKYLDHLVVERSLSWPESERSGADYR